MHYRIAGGSAMSQQAGQSFEFVVQSLASSGGGPDRKALSLPVPPGVSSLRLTPGGPRLAARDGFEPELDPSAAVVEAVQGRGRQPALLFAPPTDGGALVNGVPCPPLALLSAADQVQLGDFVFHLAVFSRPQVGPVPAEFVGRKSCPICRLRFTQGQRVYLCSNCGSTALHIAGPVGEAAGTEPADDGSAELDCVRLCSECPSCSAPISLAEGYTHYPDLER
jgi:hypothetical protein